MTAIHNLGFTSQTAPAQYNNKDFIGKDRLALATIENYLH